MVCTNEINRREEIFKLRDENGLALFKQMTQQNKKLRRCLDGENIERGCEKWYKEVDKIMHQCFIRKTVRIGYEQSQRYCPKARKIRVVLKEAAKRGKIQREIVKGYQEKLMETLGDILEKHVPLPQNDFTANKKKKKVQ